MNSSLLPETVIAPSAYALFKENKKLRELLELCSKLLWKLDKDGFINADCAEEEEERECEHLSGLAREAVAETRKFLMEHK